MYKRWLNCHNTAHERSPASDSASKYGTLNPQDQPDFSEEHEEPVEDLANRLLSSSSSEPFDSDEDYYQRQEYVYGTDSGCSDIDLSNEVMENNTTHSHRFVDNTTEKLIFIDTTCFEAKQDVSAVHPLH